MAYRVRVIGIFTRNARSSSTVEQRRARLASDIANANQVWGQGFASPPGSLQGVSCQMTFFSGGTWNFTNTTIQGSSVSGAFDSRVSSLIDNVRNANGNAAAIYIVYLSGDYLSNGFSIGSGGPNYRFYRSQSDYGYYGQVAMTDISGSTRSPYSFAHEAGHCLFGYINSSNQYIGTDPSNPGNYHNGDQQNLMYYISPSKNPFITQAQCVQARRSTIVLENAGSANNRPFNRTAKKNQLGKNNRPKITLSKDYRRLNRNAKKVGLKKRCTTGCKLIRRRS